MQVGRQDLGSRPPLGESSMGIHLKVRNFRCLRNVDWSPDGVCLLVGPNGAGKTTLFDALNFLRLARSSDASHAIAVSGGPYFRNLYASPEEAIVFSFSQRNLTWELTVSLKAGPFNVSRGIVNSCG